LSSTGSEKFIERGLAVVDSGIFVATEATLWFYDSQVNPLGSPFPSTEFSSGGATIFAVDSVVTLPRGEVEFEVTSTLADLYRPDMILSRFSLSGVGSGIVERRGATSAHEFSDLTPRSRPYLLTVSTIASTGQVFRRNFSVHVRSWIWETLWFQVATALSVITGSVGGYAARSRRRRREAVEIRTALAYGREDERKALSRHIHDDPLQALYAVRHRLELYDPAGGNGQQRLDEVADMAGRTIDSLRRICANLRPETIGHVNLDKSLASKCAAFRSDHPELDVEVDLCETGEQPEELVVALFRILQSALANVARHAQASSVVVLLESHHSHLVLKVSDDGAGFVNDTSMLALARENHFGLLGMHEWANQVGGELSIVSRPGSGTAIKITVRTSTS
jgi:signal transduction histidine kinase